jgi:hypothetical protein
MDVDLKRLIYWLAESGISDFVASITALGAWGLETAWFGAPSRGAVLKRSRRTFTAKKP